MPRPRSFDPDAVLDAAIRVFWTSGYEATSTEQLCAATGLGRGSLYHAFTSKHELYRAALERYMDLRTARLRETLEGPGPVRDRIAAVLHDAVDPDPDDPLGCMVVNTMVELGPADPVLAAALRRDHRIRHDALTAAVEAGVRAGELTSTRPADELAHFVIATISGLRVAARGGADRDTREAVARAALDAL